MNKDELIDKIRAMRSSLTIKEITERLNEEGLRTTTGKMFKPSNVRTLSLSRKTTEPKPRMSREWMR